MGSAPSSPRGSDHDSADTETITNEDIRGKKLHTKHRQRKNGHQQNIHMPPKDRKCKIFYPEDFTEVDEVAKMVSNSVLGGGFTEVAAEICQAAADDLGRTRALFSWITFLDIPALASSITETPESGTVLEAIIKIHSKRSNHAHLFARLCRAVEVPCAVISGVNKSAAYQLGSPVDQEQMGGQWNAVCIDGHWYLVDTFWASMRIQGGHLKEIEIAEDASLSSTELSFDEDVQHYVNDFYFLTDPDELIYTHLPDSMEWQLLEKPISEEQFTQSPYLKDRFFELGLKLIYNAEQGCKLLAKNGHTSIIFGMDTDKHLHTRFGYIIYILKQSEMEKLQGPLERYVLYRKCSGRVAFELRLPFAGQYRIDVFGMDILKHQYMDHAFSYLVSCENPDPDCKPYPECPEIGWGPGAECESLGLVPCSHKGARISGNVTFVEFDRSRELNIASALRNSAEVVESTLGDHVISYTDGNRLCITTRLPQKGEYGLMLYANEKSKLGKLQNICNYVINSDNEEVETGPFPSLHCGVLGKGIYHEDFGVIALSEKGGFVGTHDGLLDLKFQLQDITISLHCEVTHVSIDSTILSNCVVRTQDKDIVSFDFSFPEEGEYGINIYAGCEKTRGSLFHVHTYLCESEQYENTTGIKRRSSEIHVGEMVTETEEARINLPSCQQPLMVELRRHLVVDTVTDCKADVLQEKKENVCVAHLPHEDKYILSVFKQQPNGAVTVVKIHHLYHYIPYGQPSNITSSFSDPANHEKLRKQLKAAIRYRNKKLLSHAITEFEASKLPNNRDLTKAKRILLYETLKEELDKALSTRKIEELERITYVLEDENLTKEFNMKYKMAKAILNKHYTMEKYRLDVVNLDGKTISEVRSYKAPPVVVFKVLHATFIILGEKDSQDWKRIQSLMGRTGMESLQRLIGFFQVEKLSQKRAQAASEVLQGLDAATVRKSSAGAAAIFVWTNCMIEEAESRHEQSGHDLLPANLTPTPSQ